MLYLLDTELKEKINIRASLTKIFGVSHFKSTCLCKKLGFAKNLKIVELNKNQKLKFIKEIENYSTSVGFSLKQKLLLKKKTEIEIKSYKGLRRLKGYPVRGQRTRTNSKTAKKKLS